ncbi:hypothetical protein GDN83_05655 [Gordonia jinghuaiqii]|uniref:Uncharacterized protein n=1 Tax=Gordonia jinghuaiqii TaxID=2758710 RepID=A0A7D7R167_9ACTN|nr:hypothetical protein [Gordonia jinghuaiqii]MCR5977232.1 hypothetical protein [Gordonia jinghuaiqii]QMT00172.1 hypothetical protein H1R19_14680 [Gordonia jinghuaiqii]
MGTDEETFRQAGDGSDRGRPADPVRDLLLGLADQIDQLAVLFAWSPDAAGPKPEAGAGTSDSGRPGSHDIEDLWNKYSRGFGSAFAAGGPVDSALAGASGEITTLLREIGGLIARLIAAVVAVLEAIAEALRSAPSTGSTPRHYEPIPVRINAAAPRAGYTPPAAHPEPRPASRTPVTDPDQEN